MYTEMCSIEGAVTPVGTWYHRAKSVDCLSLDKKVDLPRLNYGFNNESAKERQKETERVIEEARKTKERLENLWNQDQDFQ